MPVACRGAEASIRVVQAHAIGRSGHRGEPDALVQTHPVTLERAADDARDFRVLTRQQSCRIEERHLASEPAEGLAELRAHGARADHEEMAGPFGKREHRLVREVGNGIEPRDLRYGGLRSRGDDEAARLDERFARLDGRPIDEGRLAP